MAWAFSTCRRVLPSHHLRSLLRRNLTFYHLAYFISGFIDVVVLRLGLVIGTYVIDLMRYPEGLGTYAF